MTSLDTVLHPDRLSIQPRPCLLTVFYDSLTVHLTPRNKLHLKRLAAQQQPTMKTRLDTHIQLPFRSHIKSPHQLSCHGQEPILRKDIARTLATATSKSVNQFAAFCLAILDRKLSAIRVSEVAVWIESVRRGKEGWIVRVDPDVLEDGCAFGNMVAAESVVCVEGVGEIYGGYGAPAKDLLAFSSCANGLKYLRSTSKKHAFRYSSLSRSSTCGGLPASHTLSTSACARFRISG